MYCVKKNEVLGVYGTYLNLYIRQNPLQDLKANPSINWANQIGRINPAYNPQ